MLIQTITLSLAVLAVPSNSILDNHSLRFEVSTPESVQEDLQDFQVVVSRIDEFVDADTQATILKRTVDYDLQFEIKDGAEDGDFTMHCNMMDLTQPQLVSMTQSVRRRSEVPSGSPLKSVDDIQEFVKYQHHDVAKVIMNVQIEERTYEEMTAIKSHVRRYKFQSTVTEVDEELTSITKMVQHIVDVYQTDSDIGGIKFVMKQHQPTFVSADVTLELMKQQYSGQSIGLQSLQAPYDNAKQWFMEQDPVVKVLCITSYLLLITAVSLAGSSWLLSFQRRINHYQQVPLQDKK